MIPYWRSPPLAELHFLDAARRLPVYSETQQYCAVLFLSGLATTGTAQDRT